MGKSLDYDKLCSCGCGGHPRRGKIYVHGHHARGKSSWNSGLTKETDDRLRKMWPQKEVLESKLCECNVCGRYASPGKRFISGHNNTGKKNSKETIEKRIKSNLGKKHAQDTIDIIKQKAIIYQNLPEVKENNRQKHLGKKSTEKTKEKIRQKMIGRIFSKNSLTLMKKFYESDEGKILCEKRRQKCIILNKEGKIGWKVKESYPEKCYRNHLESFGYVKGVDFFQEVRVGTYKLDFTFKNKMIDFEIDGKQHKTEKAIKHDKKRDEYLKSLGWIVMRLPAKILRKLLKNASH